MFLVIWKRPDDSYYYRYVRGTYAKYYEGYENQYGHVVVLVIYPNTKTVSIKERIKSSLIRYIKKL